MLPQPAGPLLTTGLPKAGRACLNLGRACLLVALEEEAAIEMHPEVEMEVKDLPLG